MNRPVLVVLDAHYFWTQELFSNCSHEFDVLLLKPRDFRAQRREQGKLLFQWKPKQIASHVWEQHFPMPPGWLFGYWGISSRLLAFFIRKFARKRQLFFAYCYPWYASLAKKLKGKSLYYSIDDYHDYWPGKGAKTNRLEEVAVRSADGVVCVSKFRQELFQRMRPKQPERILHLPHGCSTKFMVDQVLREPLPLAGAVKPFARPVCGYIGALNNRFDFAFLAKVARLMPDVQFVLGGSEPKESEGSEEWFTGVNAARQTTNVHFLGRVPHDQVGFTLQSFDVLLMAYSRCDFNTSACPMKLWDYMGTGRPVVANEAVPEVLLWKSVIRIGRTPAEYAQEIRQSLAFPLWEAERRLEIARENTWENQGRKLVQFLRDQGLLNV